MNERRAFSVAIFALCKDRVLLIHHKRLGTWLPVGGELDSDETPAEAAVRELEEETGLRGTFVPIPGAVTGTPQGLLAYEEHHAGSKGLHMNFCFLMSVPSQDVVPNGEFTEHRWVGRYDTLEAPQNVVELVGRIFAFEPVP
jgi:8-oxo-dGTP diphosphatase